MAKRMLHKLLGLVPDSSSSEEDEYGAAVVVAEQFAEQELTGRRGGSVYGRQTVYRGRLEGHARLYADYFVDNPVYGEETFRRR